MGFFIERVEGMSCKRSRLDPRRATCASYALKQCWHRRTTEFHSMLCKLFANNSGLPDY
jgi:hypothetical protein